MNREKVLPHAGADDISEEGQRLTLDFTFRAYRFAYRSIESTAEFAR